MSYDIGANAWQLGPSNLLNGNKELLKEDVMLNTVRDSKEITPFRAKMASKRFKFSDVNLPTQLQNSASFSETSSSSSSSSDDEDGNYQTHAYKYVTIKNGKDVDSIPITKDGMAVCEKCGTIGVKHAFYSKAKRFCSLSCSRSYFDMQREGKPIPKPKPYFKFPVGNVKVKKMLPNKFKRTALAPIKKAPPPPPAESDNYDWNCYLRRKDFTAVPVSSFKHAPLSDVWDNIMVGMKVEIENRDDGDLRDLYPHTYWVASVVAIAGYKVLLRYEGFVSDSSEDFWLNLCTQNVQPVGWCASQVKPLIPPRSIQHKCSDWKQFLVKRLTGARTLPSDFHSKVIESISSRFKKGVKLEVVDKNCISTVSLAYVEKVVGGRLHVRYHGSESWDDGFWCHEKSNLIHPIGWGQLVGHNVNMSPEVARAAGQKAATNKYEENEASWDMFNHPTGLTPTNIKFREGMRLEAIDPLNLSAICVATITKVLRKGYLMIGIDGYNERGTDWFCHHSTSGSIFPAGFCELNNIELTPPKEYRGQFKWQDYLRTTKSIAAPVSLFNREIPNHGFQVGMHLEAVDLMEPGLICVGTITKVIGRLLRVHFDGWEDSYDQWCDCESPDLYPVGWCELVGYHLESPKTNSFVDYDKKRKAKTPTYKGVRKKRKVRLLTYGKNKHNITHPQTTETSPIVQTTTPTTTVTEQEPVSVPAAPSDASSELILKNSEVISNDGGVTKTIPRLIDNASSGLTLTSHHSVITPELWTVFDVSQFLRINDCAAYCESFSKKKIDGKNFLPLTKEQIVNLTGMKVGPSLKIYDLIQQLKAKTKAS